MPGMGLVRDGTSCGDNLVRPNFVLNLNLLIRYSMVIILVINPIMQNHGIERKQSCLLSIYMLTLSKRERVGWKKACKLLHVTRGLTLVCFRFA